VWSKALTCCRHAQIREADILTAAAVSETPERARALLHRALVELLPGVMAVVERRRLAGTLLHGKCAPHEVEWSCQLLTASGIRATGESALYSQLVGYDAYLRTARLGLYWAYKSHEPSSVSPQTAVQTQQIFSYAETALDMMSAPRLANDKCFPYEATLLSEVFHTLKLDNVHLSLEYRNLLEAALARLKGSGVFEERGMNSAMQGLVRESKLLQAKAQAEIEAPGLRSCTHCGARELHVDHFKRCAACKGPRFCSKDCQLANWQAHKADCKAARKAAAGAAAST
jgi:hypothetical protein